MSNTMTTAVTTKVDIGALDYEPSLTETDASGRPTGNLQVVIGDYLDAAGAVVTDAASGQTVPSDIVAALLAASSGDTIYNNPDMRDIVGSITESVFNHVTSDGLGSRKLHLSAAYGRTKRLPPGKQGDHDVVYTIHNDVRPDVGDYISARNNGSDCRAEMDNLFTSIGGYAHLETLGVAIADAAAYQRFHTYLMTIANRLAAAGHITPGVQRKCAKTADLIADDASLTEGIQLRNHGDEPGGDHTFARVFHFALHHWLVEESSDPNAPLEAAMMPFDLGQWVCPTTVLFINITACSIADTRDISRHWASLTAALSNEIRMVSLRDITKLSDQVNNVYSGLSLSQKAPSPPKRRIFGTEDFPDDPPRPIAAARDVLTMLTRAGNVAMSQNPYLVKKKTLSRQSRRHPDNLNVPGTLKTRQYHPDIHIYADYSMSMYDSYHIDVMLFIAELAEKLNINFYFSSFSHYLSEEVLLPVKGLSRNQLTKLITSIPKVSGSTDFDNIYKYINVSPERSKRLNIIATDFGWLPYADQTIHHPESVIYVPSFDRSDPDSWQKIVSYATAFIYNMQEHDPHIASRLCGMALR